MVDTRYYTRCPLDRAHRIIDSKKDRILEIEAESAAEIRSDGYVKMVDVWVADPEEGDPRKKSIPRQKIGEGKRYVPVQVNTFEE